MQARIHGRTIDCMPTARFIQRGLLPLLSTVRMTTGSINHTSERTRRLRAALWMAATLTGLLIGGPLAATEVYKWVDNSGRVHYGERPPSEGIGERVEIDSSPTGVEIAPNREEWRPAVSPDRIGEASTGHADPPAPRAAEATFDCYSSVEAALGGRSSLLTGETPIRPLTETEQDLIVALLSSTLGHWKVEIGETECLGPPSNPEIRRRRYQSRPKVDWLHRGPWRIEATLEGYETRSVSDHVLWLQVEDGSLYFGANDTTQTTQEQSRVVPLSVGADHLSWGRWYRRPSGSGGSIARTRLLTLQLAGDGFSLEEASYTQGGLSQVRHWRFTK